MRIRPRLTPPATPSCPSVHRERGAVRGCHTRAAGRENSRERCQTRQDDTPSRSDLGMRVEYVLLRCLRPIENPRPVPRVESGARLIESAHSTLVDLTGDAKLIPDDPRIAPVDSNVKILIHLRNVPFRRFSRLQESYHRTRGLQAPQSDSSPSHQEYQPKQRERDTHERGDNSQGQRNAERRKDHTKEREHKSGALSLEAICIAHVTDANQKAPAALDRAEMALVLSYLVGLRNDTLEDRKIHIIERIDIQAAHAGLVLPQLG